MFSFWYHPPSYPRYPSSAKKQTLYTKLLSGLILILYPPIDEIHVRRILTLKYIKVQSSKMLIPVCQGTALKSIHFHIFFLFCFSLKLINKRRRKHTLLTKKVPGTSRPLMVPRPLVYFQGWPLARDFRLYSFLSLYRAFFLGMEK